MLSSGYIYKSKPVFTVNLSNTSIDPMFIFLFSTKPHSRTNHPVIYYLLPFSIVYTTSIDLNQRLKSLYFLYCSQIWFPELTSVRTLRFHFDQSCVIKLDIIAWSTDWISYREVPTEYYSVKYLSLEPLTREWNKPSPSVNNHNNFTLAFLA